jgi:hypothetical protein
MEEVPTPTVYSMYIGNSNSYSYFYASSAHPIYGVCTVVVGNSLEEIQFNLTSGTYVHTCFELSSLSVSIVSLPVHTYNWIGLKRTDRTRVDWPAGEEPLPPHFYFPLLRAESVRYILRLDFNSIIILTLAHPPGCIFPQIHNNSLWGNKQRRYVGRYSNLNRDLLDQNQNQTEMK